MRPEYETLLNKGALKFLTALVETYTPRIEGLLKSRQTAKYYKRGPGALQFLHATKGIRDQSWKASPVPTEISDRRVEITGPVSRKMIINALNSGANVFMADFEDSNSPTWENCMNGQVNLCDAVNETIEYYDSTKKKEYRLNKKTAVLFVRPRGLHLRENNIWHDGKPIPAALFDYGLYVYTNAINLMEKGTRPYFYLPKLENHVEAKVWNSIFTFSEEQLGIPFGSIKATVLIETLTAAYQMDEILHQLKDHSAGLNCGRWDYIFSIIKWFKENPNFIFPDRDQVTMTQHFMRAYTQLLVQTCHKRGVHAIGGMAAQIPIKGNEKANQNAISKVQNDKLREVHDGHDGTWVAHPGLVVVAKQVFDEHMPTPNQINNIPIFNQAITEEDLIVLPKGTCTEKGLRKNIRIGLQYLDAWLEGNGCVPINNLMEDAATAEISRTQIWQWLHHQITLTNGERVTTEKFIDIFDEETNQLRFKNDNTVQLFKNMCLRTDLEEFLTLEAYEVLEERNGKK